MVFQNVAAFVVLLSVLIFMHELGHFLAAKALNVKVTRFSIGFGPRIFGFTRGETEYRLAWVPLGGYVKMAGDMGEEGGGAEEDARGFLAQAPWRRAVIISAGPAASLGFPLLVYLAIFLFFPQPAPRVMALEAGMPAALAGVRVGDLVTAIDDTPIRTADQLDSALDKRGGKEMTLTVDRDGRAVRLKLVAARSREAATGKLGILPGPRLPLIGVPAGGAAARAGLRTFDRILAVDGKPVHDLESLEHQLDEARGDVIRLELLRREPAELPGVDAYLPGRLQVDVPRQPGQGVQALGVEPSDLYVARVLSGSAAEKAGLVRGDRLVALDGQPLLSFYQLRSRQEAIGDAPFRLVWRHEGQERTEELRQQTINKDVYGREVKGLGLELGPRITRFDGKRALVDQVRLGPLEAVVAAFSKLGETIALVAVQLALLLTGQLPFSNLGGPIMLYGITAQSAQLGPEYYLSVMALISINLGLLNLLPIPVLDGFGLLSAFWEWIRRRPIPARAREVANMIGLAVLVLLMLAVFKNDIARALM